MMIDYSASELADASAILFPTFTFAVEPRQDPIVETVILLGGSSTNSSVLGDVDGDE
jgi:hypothetical protein